MKSYDREGKPIDLMTWGKLLGGLDYKRVDKTELDGYYISTIWLGLDHRMDDQGGRPLIFETMVFTGGFNGVYCDQYETLEAAKDGHQRAIEWCKEHGGLIEIDRHLP